MLCTLFVLSSDDKACSSFFHSFLFQLVVNSERYAWWRSLITHLLKICWPICSSKAPNKTTLNNSYHAGYIRYNVTKNNNCTSLPNPSLLLKKKTEQKKKHSFRFCRARGEMDVMVVYRQLQFRSKLIFRAILVKI